MAVLFNAGDHVPIIPLVDIVGNGDNVVPEQTDAIAAKVGVTSEIHDEVLIVVV